MLGGVKAAFDFSLLVYSILDPVQRLREPGSGSVMEGPLLVAALPYQSPWPYEVTAGWLVSTPWALTYLRPDGLK